MTRYMYYTLVLSEERQCDPSIYKGYNTIFTQKLFRDIKRQFSSCRNEIQINLDLSFNIES